LIYVIQHGTPAQIELIRHAISNKSAEHLSEIQTAIAESNALDYCRGCAKREAQSAIDALKILPNSVYKTALIDLAQFSYQRAY